MWKDVKIHNDTVTLFFSNKNGQNLLKNSYLKDSIMLNDMWRDLFSTFQNQLTTFFSLQKNVGGSVKGNKNSHLSLLSLTARAAFTLKWRDHCSKRVLKQQESCVNLIRSFTIITMINPRIWCNWHCRLFWSVLVFHNQYRNVQ